MDSGQRGQRYKQEKQHGFACMDGGGYINYGYIGYTQGGMTDGRGWESEFEFGKGI